MPLLDTTKLTPLTEKEIEDLEEAYTQWYDFPGEYMINATTFANAAIAKFIENNLKLQNN